MTLRYFLPGIIWFIIVTILLCLPGDNLPDSNFLNIPHFDKYVHMGLFFWLTAFFCYGLIKSKADKLIRNRWFAKIALIAIAYGALMEVVQKYLVPNRSFDVTDIIFDAAGCVITLLLAPAYYKKIGPDRNRGRNQN